MNENIATILLSLSVAIFSYYLVKIYFSVSSANLQGFESVPTDPFIILIKELINPIVSILEKYQDNPSLANELRVYKRLILSSGVFFNLSALEIYAIKIILPVLFIIFFLPLSLLLPFDVKLSVSSIIAFSVLLYFYPTTALNDKAKKRRELFLRQLPGGLDILKIAADAGLDFQNSIKYLVQIYIPGPVKEEFSIFLREIKLGIPATEALANISYRIDMPEVCSIFISLSQSIEMGTSISGILSDIVTELRKKRLLSAETEAQKTVVKITFPLLFLILPGIFIVLLAPLIKPIMQALSGL
ncbi:MAG TPA: type II secretion system F family protein [Victivallales bacterium]|nr:type II secretion system F family protein [Victivallales bacterium]HRU01746.1 type II secretion system F family protein [Victivallales bacterium]